MGFLEVLTLIFVVLKLMGYVDWSWLMVLSPVIFSFSLYLIFIIGFILTRIFSK